MAKNYTLALRKSMKQLGTYRPEYESAIAIAAQLMEQFPRLQQFARGGIASNRAPAALETRRFSALFGVHFVVTCLAKRPAVRQIIG